MLWDFENEVWSLWRWRGGTDVFTPYIRTREDGSDQDWMIMSWEKIAEGNDAFIRALHDLLTTEAVNEHRKS